MKKVLMFIMVLVFACSSLVVHAQNEVVTQTQETKIICWIDGLFIESYAIEGFMYLPLEKLTEYGFNLNKRAEGIELERNKIVYFDGCYDEIKINGGLPVYKNPTPVIINGKVTNTYMVEDKIVIQAEELLAFGDVAWNEQKQEVVIFIIENELINAFESAEDRVKETYGEYGSLTIDGQKQNGEWNGIVRTSQFDSMTYYGYMINGEYEGVVYGYRQPKRNLPEEYELKTVRNGKLNGYRRYKKGHSNTPNSPGTTDLTGMYENGELKNGTYKKITDIMSNTATYVVQDFNHQIISATRNGHGYQQSSSQVFYNGDLINFDVAPVIENDRTLIPLRGLFEKMGAVVEWDEKNKTAIVTKDDMVLSVKIDHYGATVNNSCKYMDVPARLVEGRTMIPLRFLSEELGYTVVWNESDNSITIE